MKKVIVIFLAWMLCFSLFACSNGETAEKYKKYEALIDYLEAEDYENAYKELDELSKGKGPEEQARKAILGTWVSMGGYEILFREDTTVVLDGEGDRFEGKWTYAKDLDCYTVAMNGAMISVFLKNDGEISYVEFRNMKFYSRDVFEAKLPEHLETVRKEFAAKVDGMEKAEWNQEYTAEGFSVKFDIVLEDGDFWVNATITNLGTEAIRWIGGEDCRLDVGFKRECYYYGSWRTLSHGITLDFAFAEGVEEIAPGKTTMVKAKLCGGVDKMLENYGVVLGYATCSIGEKDYYLDFSDYQA